MVAFIFSSTSELSNCGIKNRFLSNNVIYGWLVNKI